MQKIFQDGNKFYLVETFENGIMTIKVKENGWGDIWSLPIKEIK